VNRPAFVVGPTPVDWPRLLLRAEAEAWTGSTLAAGSDGEQHSHEGGGR
jgi:hypothetical protein